MYVTTRCKINNSLTMKYSFIIPIYNRPDELDELLQSLTAQQYNDDFEVVVVDDGSPQPLEAICLRYPLMNISYYRKANTGPGDSRNYGMQRAKHDYFIILDSDCIVPPHYLATVDAYLQNHYVDCFGGADAANAQFTDIQKAINYAMTSLLTTGGIRGNKRRVQRFEPRSFNMGLSRRAFEATKGFKCIHPGEDPDLVIRLWGAGFQTAFIPDAYVYHKRRISWDKFRVQVNKFGQTRAILNYWHPHTRKLTFWFPTLFSIGFLVAITALFMGFSFFWWCYMGYFTIIYIDSALKNRSLVIGALTLWAVLLQFFSYGVGFLWATLKIFLVKKPVEVLFPKLFF